MAPGELAKPRQAHHEVNQLKTLNLILSLSKPYPELVEGRGRNSRFFSILLVKRRD
jgi:hypothetical protein